MYLHNEKHVYRFVLFLCLLGILIGPLLIYKLLIRYKDTDIPFDILLLMIPLAPMCIFECLGLHINSNSKMLPLNIVFSCYFWICWMLPFIYLIDMIKLERSINPRKPRNPYKELLNLHKNNKKECEYYSNDENCEYRKNQCI